MDSALIAAAWPLVLPIALGLLLIAVFTPPGIKTTAKKEDQ